MTLIVSFCDAENGPFKIFTWAEDPNDPEAYIADYTTNETWCPNTYLPNTSPGCSSLRNTIQITEYFDMTNAKDISFTLDFIHNYNGGTAGDLWTDISYKCTGSWIQYSPRVDVSNYPLKNTHIYHIDMSLSSSCNDYNNIGIRIDQTNYASGNNYFNMNNVCIQGNEIITSPPTASPNSPSVSPTAYPTQSPTGIPSVYPSSNPSVYPSSNPSNYPSINPSGAPSKIPSNYPTNMPTNTPTTTNGPSNSPTGTNSPSNSPSNKPTDDPTNLPTKVPSRTPTDLPIVSPTEIPTGLKFY